LIWHGYCKSHLQTARQHHHMSLRIIPPALAAAATCVTLQAFAPAFAGTAWQDVREIATAARRQAESVTAPAHHLAPPAATVDPLLRLPECDVPLQASAGSYRAGARRLTVQVECTGRVRGRVWVPVTLRLRVPVVVASRPVPRGTLLGPGDLTLVERESDGSSQPAASVQSLVGRRARADIPAGQPVGAANTTAEQLIRRGQQVIILTTGSGISVSGRGIAQGDGGLGSRIRVRSVASDRVVEGVVRSSEVVEILLPGAGRG
jgi:flagella basal body P-ring formation protein FlgA